jgi:hypothetical protein
MPHPEDQNGLSKEYLLIIIIHSVPNEWQQEFELNHAKTSDQSIHSVLVYSSESQQLFKDQNKHLTKNSFQTITQNRLCIAEGNRVMFQENKCVSRQFYNEKFTPSGRGRAHAIVNAAGHAWDHQATVRHQDFQASCMYHDYRGPCLVHPEAGTHTWGNCFQNPHTRGGRADCTAGRHNGHGGHSGFGGRGHFGGC